MGEFKNKLVAVMNEKKEQGGIMNALAHLCFGMGAGLEDKRMARLTNYRDADGQDHKDVSELPFIVLKANSNKIRELRKAAIENNIHYVDFTHTMTVGTYVEQIEWSAQTKEEELEYLGICLFGEWDSVSQLTKKFSLWR